MYISQGISAACGKHIVGDRVDTEKSSFSYFHALDVEYYVTLTLYILSSYYRHVWRRFS
jgi:hypothetical protein